MLAMLAIPATRRAFSASFQDARAFGDALKVWWVDMPKWLRWFTILATVVSVLRFGFLIWSLPPFVYDSLTYHPTNVAHWTQTGSIELFETSVAWIYTPANYEALAAWLTIFLRHDAVIEAAGLPAYVLAILAVYAGIRGIGVSRAVAWMGALSYASLPALLLATTGTKNDPHMASYYLSSLA
jgi:small-conductance mechanosensitive channel